jgi:hypothetical protein
MGWKSCKVQQKTEVVHLYLRIENMTDGRLVKMIHHCSLSVHKSWDAKVLTLLNAWHVAWLIDIDWSTKRKLEFIDELLTNIDQREWMSDLWNDKNKPNGNKLRTYRI